MSLICTTVVLSDKNFGGVTMSRNNFIAKPQQSGQESLDALARTGLSRTGMSGQPGKNTQG
jgi:hypothetical protein